MRRRNFLSALLAAPLALKVRYARFYVRKRPVELCGAAVFGALALAPCRRALNDYQTARNRSLTPRQREVIEANSFALAHCQPVHCSLPRGHKGLHMLLNPR